MGGLEPYSLIWSPMSDIALEPAQSETDQTVLILAHDGPLAVSVASDGVNYLCSGCSRLVLQDVHPRQFLSILIRCVRCGGISATPRRDGGEPIPAYSVVAPAGQYLLGSQLNVPGPGMFAARAAAEDYAFEVGAPYSERARQHAAMFPSGMSPETLRQISAMGRSILGVHFDRFDAMYERSKRHSTQAPDHHRLVDLIRYGDKAANQIESAGRGGQVTIDGNRIAELYTAISMFHRWRNHPAWDDLVASLADPSHVQHTVMLMCLASYLADVGNGVGIVHSEQASGRIPDAWVAVDSRGRIDIEIKTPHAFREPGSALSFERAVEIIERHVMRAGSISGGQIGEGRPGIIGFGAYHLGPGGVDLIAKAAHEVLRRRGGRRSHIAGIVVVEVTYQTSQMLGRLGKPIATDMQPVLLNRIAMNSDYSRDILISTETPQWLTMQTMRQPQSVIPPEAVGSVGYPKVGRNDPCPCGSGRKYKHCHGGS